MIDTIALKTSLIDFAVTGKLSSSFHASDSVSDVIAALPEVSHKRRRLLEQTFEYGKQSEIPSHWRWVRLGEIASYGDTPTKAFPRDVSGDTWVLDLEDIKSGGEILTKARGHERKFAGDKTVFKKGQVLYSKLRPYLKKVLVADEDGVSTPELISFDTYGGILPQYIVYCLVSSFTARAIDKRSYGIKMPRVDAGFMVNLPIPLPPVSEQRFIVDRVQTAFSQIATIDALQSQYTDNLAALKSKLIEAAIQGKLTEHLSEDGTAEDLYRQIQAEKATIIKERKGRIDKGLKAVGQDVPYVIPPHWKWIRFGEIGLFKKGPFGSSLTKSMFVPPSANAIKVYEQQHAIQKNPSIGTYYISENYFRDKMTGFEVKSGDIIISCAGTIGETYVMPDGIEPGIINQALMRVILAPGIEKRFFQYYFESELKNSAKAGNGSAIVNIPPFEVVKNWYFPLPPIAEQKRIVAKLDGVLEMIGQTPPRALREKN